MKGIRILLCAGLLCAGLVSTSAVAQERTFSIGTAFDLTGNFSSFGRQAREGFDLAIKTWRAVKGDTVAGRKLRVVQKDAQSNAQVAVSSFLELMNNENVDMIVGPDASDIASAVVPSWRQKASRPIWLLPGVTSTKAEGLIGDDPYFFHGFGWAYVYSEDLVRTLNTVLDKDHRRIAILYSDGAYGRSQYADAKEALGKAGYTIVDDELMREGSPDIGSLIVKLRRAKPDVLYVPVQTGDAIQVAKQLYVAKVDISFLIGTGSIPLSEWQRSVGAAQSCWIGMTSWLPGLNYPADKKEPKIFPADAEWEAAFKKEYGHESEYNGAANYAMTLLGLLAADKGGDREQIMQNLATSEYMTPYGYAKFGPSRIAKHNAFFDMVVFQRQPAGKDGFRSVVLSPPEAANGKPIRCN